MKKILAVVGVLLVVAIAAVLVVPSFVDWNQYKGEIAAQVKAATGQSIEIAGDVDLSVVPAPTLNVEGLRVAAPGGGGELLSVGALRVRVALLPLLNGRLEMQSGALVNPVLTLSVDEGGRPNWLPRPDAQGPVVQGQPGSPPPQRPEAAPTVSAGAQVRLESLTIEDGVVIYRDARSGLEERVEDIDATVSAQSLRGPFSVTGGLVSRGLPTAFELGVGRYDPDGATPVTLTVQAGDAAATAELSGVLRAGDAGPRLEGKLKLAAADAARAVGILASFSGSTPALPRGLSVPFELTGRLVADSGGADLDSISMKLDRTQATGALTVGLDGIPRADLVLVVGTMDVDAWLTGMNGGGGSAAASSPAGGGGSAAPAERKDAPADSTALSVPQDLAGSIDIMVDTVAYRGGVMRNLRLSAALQQGRLVVSRLGAELPGATDLALSGEAANGADGGAAFAGDLDLEADDARSLLQWLAVDVSQVPADRLRRLSLKARLGADGREVRLEDAALGLDASKITGGATVALRARPAFGLSLTVDRLNADAYLPPSRPDPAASKAEAAKENGGAGKLVEEPGSKSATGASTLAFLNGFDANLQARVGRLVVNGTAVENAAIDATLYNGALAVRGLTIGDLAGARIALDGTVSGFEARPQVKLRYTLSAQDPAGVAQLAGLSLPAGGAKVGPVELKGDVETQGTGLRVRTAAAAAGGTATASALLKTLSPAAGFELQAEVKHPQPNRLIALFAPGAAAHPAGQEPMEATLSLAAAPGEQGRMNGTVDAKLMLAGGTVAAAGQLSDLAVTSGYDLKVSAEFPDMVRAVRLLAPDYRPAGQNLGPLKLLANGEGSGTSIRLSGLQGQIGPVNVKGNLAADLSGVRPRIALSLSAGDVVADQFLPAKAARGQGGGGRGGIPAASGRWSREPIDAGALRAADVELDLAMTSLHLGKLKLSKAVAKARLEDGLLTLGGFTAEAFGGTLGASGTLSPAGQGVAGEAVLSARQLDVAQLLATYAESARATGAVDLDATLSTGGSNEAELVSALAGRGEVKGRVQVQARREEAAGAALMAILGTQLKELQGTADVLTAMLVAFGGGPADLSGTFVSDRGIVTTQDTRLQGSGGLASATGQVNLPAWTIDMDGAVHTGGTGGDPALTAKVRGPLDAPDTVLGGAAIRGGISAGATGGLGIVEKILPGLGGRKETTPEPPAAQPQEQAPAQPEKINPQKLIEGILKGLGG